MAKIGRPPRLIAYDTDINIKRRLDGKPPIYRIVRPRTVIYAGIIAVVGLMMLYTLVTRRLVEVNVLHDRNPVFVMLSDGSIRNAYTVRLLNKSNESRALQLDVEGVPHGEVHVIGDIVTVGVPIITIGPDQTREVRILVTVPPGLLHDESLPVTFHVTDPSTGEKAAARDHFIGPH